MYTCSTSASPELKKQRHVCGDEEMMFEFPNDDLTIEVLTRLPARPLLRFRCVSKGWQSIISNVSFRRAQIQQSKPILSGFFFQERFQWCDDDIKSINYISVDSEKCSLHYTILDFLPEKVVLMSSSNGLLCCRSCSDSPHPLIYVCNPSTKEYTTLEWASRPFKADSLALVFDPFEICLGISTSFKLIRLDLLEPETEDEIDEGMELQFSFEVYSSKTGEWRSIEKAVFCKFPLYKNEGVFTSGFVYWQTGGDKILSFDIENEQLQLVDVPHTVHYKGVPELCIGESEGSLHCIKISEAGLQDWILKNTSESEWALMHSISLAELEKEYPTLLYNLSKRIRSRVTAETKCWLDPLAFKDGLLFMTVCNKVYSYKFESRRMCELCNLDSLGPNSFGFPIVLPFSMSLVPMERPVIVL